MEQEIKLIAEIPKEKLTKKVNFIKDLIIFKNEEDDLTSYLACRNRCHHKGGTFLRDIEEYDNRCVLTCSNHGWKLDVKKMEYVNPSAIKHMELGTEEESETLKIFEITPPKPWKIDENERYFFQRKKMKRS